MTKILIDAKINAPIQKVWDYYTAPEYITQWNFADPSWCCPSASNDLQIGGKYLARMEARDGSHGFDFEAIYDEIIPYESFTYTGTDDRKVAVNFVFKENQTLVSIVFDAENTNPIAIQRAGWQAILDNFKKYVEQS